MTEQFRHKYLKSYHVRHRYAEWGGLQTDALVIVANIPLERGSDGYDESKVEDLSKAVSRYVVSRRSPYSHIEFVEEFNPATEPATSATSRPIPLRHGAE